ncbi:dTMP kinase [Amycolatopsis anabasis]|uniref:dTMP kinase n=1 Tax=Amycolatopsis anabasis TaxID=1840409 RepID=UPI00131C77AC|nr:dTMP kinase [Amycolatopsis anabasis]
MNTEHGAFISVDGPRGVGTSTTVQALAERLRAAGLPVFVNSEPTDSDIGALACSRASTDTSRHARACLFAADRYQRLKTDIRPRLAAGDIVISDRYVPTGLVRHRLDGVDLGFLQALHAAADPPDLAVILTADPSVIAQRRKQRGSCTGCQPDVDLSTRETGFYRDAARALAAAGVVVLPLETSLYSPHTLASMIHTRIDVLLAHQRRRNPAPQEPAS